MKKYLLIFLIPFLLGANWYVDKDATGTNAGTSWTNAWHGFDHVTWGAGGVVAGDTLYISGGSTTKTYTATANSMITVGDSGTSDNPITIKIGQDSGHTGTAIFDADATYYNLFDINGKNYIVLDGNYGGERHFKFQNSETNGTGDARALINIAGTTGSTVQYCEFLTAESGIEASWMASGTIAYNYIHDIRQVTGIKLAAAGSCTAYDEILVHHNEISPNVANDSGDGVDGIQGTCGISFYNNNLHGGVGGTITINPEHADLIQAAGEYWKIYNNDIYDCASSCIDMDLFGRNKVEHVMIYNNVFHYTQAFTTVTSPLGIYSTSGTINSIDDLIIANNTFVDFYLKAGFGISFNSGNPTVSNTLIKNNIWYNCGVGGTLVDIGASSNATAADWNFDYNLINAGASGVTSVSIDGSAYTQDNGQTGAPSFTTYTQRGASNVFTLQSGDTAAKDNGTSLSTYFTTDKDGVSRGAAWDIGAYEYVPPTEGTTCNGVEFNGVTFQ